MYQLCCCQRGGIWSVAVSGGASLETKLTGRCIACTAQAKHHVGCRRVFLGLCVRVDAGKEKLLFAAREGLRGVRGRVSLVPSEISIEPVLLAGAMALLEQVRCGANSSTDCGTDSCTASSTCAAVRRTVCCPSWSQGASACQALLLGPAMYAVTSWPQRQAQLQHAQQHGCWKRGTRSSAVPITVLPLVAVSCRDSCRGSEALSLCLVWLHAACQLYCLQGRCGQ